MEEILKRTTNGFISFCTKCHAYHVEFGRKIFLRMPVKGFYCALYPDELKELRRLIDFSLTDDAIESALSLENYCLN